MNKLVVIPVIVAIAAIAIYYTSPLFTNTTIDEPIPISMKETMEKDTMAMGKDAMEESGAKPAILLMGNFVGAGDGIHNAEGTAKVLDLKDGMSERVLRFEEFRSTNGPDLYVYLSKDARSIDGGYIDLGRLKGNVGNQNYEIPHEADLHEYSYVLIWCKQFSVLFGYANLA